MAKTAAIVSTCQIKDIKIKQDGTELRFDDLQLTSNQIKQVSEIIKEKETVEISLTPVQGKLPLDEEKE